MRLIRAVFGALQTFDRGATVRELQRESGLEREEVRIGLRGLKRRSLLVFETVPRRGGVYRLVPGAKMPEDLRGSYVRDTTHRAQMRIAYLGYRPPCAQGSAVGLPHGHVPPRIVPGDYSAASPPSPSNAPGALRVVVKGVLDLGGASSGPRPEISSCALANFWKKSS